MPKTGRGRRGEWIPHIITLPCTYVEFMPLTLICSCWHESAKSDSEKSGAYYRCSQTVAESRPELLLSLASRICASLRLQTLRSTCCSAIWAETTVETQVYSCSAPRGHMREATEKKEKKSIAPKPAEGGGGWVGDGDRGGGSSGWHPSDNITQHWFTFTLLSNMTKYQVIDLLLIEPRPVAEHGPGRTHMCRWIVPQYHWRVEQTQTKWAHTSYPRIPIKMMKTHLPPTHRNSA